MKDEKKLHGAALERGRIVGIADGEYRVESLDRPGMISTAAKVFSEEEISLWDSVFFYLFADGDSMILCRR